MSSLVHAQSGAFIGIQVIRSRRGGSAAHLAAALDTCHALGLTSRVPFIAAVARDLPDADSTRQLADLLRG
jgi:hypothetical protein